MGAMDLDEVVRLLRTAPGGPASLCGEGGLLAGLAVSPSSLHPYLHFRRNRYTRNLVYRDERVEVLVNCWAAGSCSPIHDHGGQECWFGIQSGTFVLENYPLLAGGAEPGPAVLGPPQVLGPLGVGHMDFRGAESPVHRVTVEQGPAVSLHVYAGPVDACLVYDVRRQRAVPRRLRYHSRFGRPVPESAGPSPSDAS